MAHRRFLHGGRDADEVGGAKEVADGLDGAGLGLVPAHVAFELFIAGGRAQQRDQVAAGRPADDADVIRVDVVSGGIRAGSGRPLCSRESAPGNAIGGVGGN